MRFLVYLDIPFDTIADAVTASTGGPKYVYISKSSVNPANLYIGKGCSGNGSSALRGRTR